MKILVTGAAGFIGYHLCKKLLLEGHVVVGIDNVNDYYDVNLKYARLQDLGISRENAIAFLKNCQSDNFTNLFSFIRINLEDRIELPKLFKAESFDIVVNLAAQAGVRYSIDNPEAYIDSNVVGYLNVLECCRNYNVKKFLYASSSSVYGNSSSVPFLETDNVDQPISLYAATKKSNELMAHTYSHLFDIETIGLRFFTVYGPWGRPDMAMFLFTDAILNNRPIKVFNNGNLSRDFTFIDDIVRGIIGVIDEKPSKKLYNIFNIGNNNPVQLMDFIKEIEDITGIEADKIMMPMQPGDVSTTWADTTSLNYFCNYKSATPVNEGVSQFVTWYRKYYNL